MSITAFSYDFLLNLFLFLALVFLSLTARPSNNPPKNQDSFDSTPAPKSLDSKPLSKEAITMSTSSLKPGSNNLAGMHHSTPSAKNTMSIDASPIRPVGAPASGDEAGRAKSESVSANESKIEDADQSKEDETKLQSK